MFTAIHKAYASLTILKVCIRNLSSTEVSAALRPFYFAVHPDLFGQYPTERAMNETSLQQLSSVLANIQASRPVKPTNLTFYVKDKSQKNASFRLVKIHLHERDVRSVVIKILRSCSLPTDYVDNVKPAKAETPLFKFKYKNDIDFTNMSQNHPVYAHIVMQKKMKEAQESLKLRYWLKKNYKEALEKSKKGKAYREEITKLREGITKELELLDLRWECGWDETHFRGCLLSFRSLVDQHPEIRPILKGRILVFSFFTGVNLDGHVMLYSGEVRNNWLDFIKKISEYDAALLRIPAFEKSLSHVLKNIKVKRRKFMPQILAGTYEENLRQITTTMSDYRVKTTFPKEWPHTLENYEIVVETEAGPLMVSPTGQFIVPSTIPGAQLVNFITHNLQDADKKNRDYQSDKYLERALTKTCIEELHLFELLKDDNITPDLMIKCCNRLLQNKSELDHMLTDVRLNISTYYSVLSDGVVCIPWNFVL